MVTVTLTQTVNTPNLIGKTNYGYTIIAASQNRHGEVVALGFKRGEYWPEYVTWLYNPSSNSYFWGHYTDNFQIASADYTERLSR